MMADLCTSLSILLAFIASVFAGFMNLSEGVVTSSRVAPLTTPCTAGSLWHRFAFTLVPISWGLSVYCMHVHTCMHECVYARMCVWHACRCQVAVLGSALSSLLVTEQ